LLEKSIISYKNYEKKVDEAEAAIRYAARGKRLDIYGETKEGKVKLIPHEDFKDDEARIYPLWDGDRRNRDGDRLVQEGELRKFRLIDWRNLQVNKDVVTDLFFNEGITLEYFSLTQTVSWLAFGYIHKLDGYLRSVDGFFCDRDFIDNDKKISQAKQSLLELLKNKNIEIRGREDGKGGVVPVPLDFRLLDIFCNIEENSLYARDGIHLAHPRRLPDRDTYNMVALFYGETAGDKSLKPWREIHIKQEDVAALSIPEVKLTKKMKTNPYGESHYIKSTDAIMWIVFREWITYEEAAARYVEKDIFWINPFETPGLSGARKNLYGIPKKRMLNFVEARLRGTKVENIKSEGTDPIYLDKMLQEVCGKFKMPIQDIAIHLRRSIALEDDWCGKINFAAEALIGEALGREFLIFGRKGSNRAILEEIPLTDLMNCCIEPAGNQLLFRNESWWKDLQVEKAKVLEKWREHCAEKLKDEKAAPVVTKLKKGGRPKGAGSLLPKDKLLFEEMKLSKTQDPSLSDFAAATLLAEANKIAGHGTKESKIKRLVENFKKYSV